jgi:membrane protein
MATERCNSNQSDQGNQNGARQDISSRGWREILLRAWRGSNKKNISLIAGGVTFYVVMALAPGFASLVSVYGLLADPHQIERQGNALSGLLAPSARTMIDRQLHMIVATSPRALGLGAVIGVLVAVYTACRGMGGMIAALDIAYGEKERRGLVRFYLTAFGLVVGGMISLTLVGVLIVVGIDANVDPVMKWLMLIAGWPALLLFMSVLLALLYHYGPDRQAPLWRWTSPGAVVASSLWVVGTFLIYVYVSHFGDYNRIYGSLSAVMVFLSWLWSSIYLVLLGAEMNAEAERQARLRAKITTLRGTLR